MGNFYWNRNNSLDDEDEINNRVEISGLVLAIVAAFIWWIPITGFIFAIIAIIFCRKNLKNNRSNIGAKVGNVSAIFSLVLSGCITFLFFGSFIISTMSVVSTVDRVKKNSFENQVELIEDWFEKEYSLTYFNGNVSDEFVYFCGKSGKYCEGSLIRFRVSGGKEVLDKIGVNTDNIDLVNSSIKIDDGRICVILYGSEEGGYSDFTKEKIERNNLELIKSNGCDR